MTTDRSPQAVRSAVQFLQGITAAVFGAFWALLVAPNLIDGLTPSYGAYWVVELMGPAMLLLGAIQLLRAIGI